MLHKFLPIGLVGWLLFGAGSWATESLPTPLEPSFSLEPLEVELLTNPSLAKGRQDVVTDETLSARYLTNPSLWWTWEQLPKKLVLHWIAYPQRRYVDIIVNPQFWNLLDYGDRYALINKYGIIAGRQGYNVRIFNLRFDVLQPIVAYTCNSKADDSLAVTLRDRACRIQWQENSQKILDVDTLGR
jgi:hypothetical protein